VCKTGEHVDDLGQVSWRTVQAQPKLIKPGMKVLRKSPCFSFTSKPTRLDTHPFFFGTFDCADNC